jgi:hypothetical protein
MRTTLRAARCAVMTALLLSACGDDEPDVRDGASGMLADSAVLAAMRSVDSGGRIIYDPPPDLSLASAQQRRPEIFRPPPPAAPAAPARRP